MTHILSEQHAKTLIAIIVQSDHWKLHAEKKPLFHNEQQALDYLKEHNEPLYIRVPLAGLNDHLEVEVSSSEQDMVFSCPKLHKNTETRLHQSHLKLIASTVTEMLHQALPAGQKIVPY